MSKFINMGESGQITVKIIIYKYDVQDAKKIR